MSGHAPFQPSVPRQAMITVIVVLAAILGLWVGWQAFWFMTDDAYIAFRYVSNSVAGYGYTWNLPPFLPVEGYTSFLWVLLLDGIWRVMGVEPPAAANVLSFTFALGTLLLSAVMLLKMKLCPELIRFRLHFLVFCFLLLLTNRTFLTWSSSGLETAMFNFWVLAWVYATLMVPSGSSRWLGGVTSTAVVAALTRPDGLLLVAASLLLSALTFWRWRHTGLFRWRTLWVLAPFLITSGHFLWRKSTYHAWLPNTFAAKYVSPWPESGARYVLSFVMEYALWVWLALVIWALVTYGRTAWRPAHRPAHLLWVDATLAPFAVAVTVIATLLAHFAYYTFIIGGDYFEYRVYSHLLPLIFLSAVWLFNVAGTRGMTAVIFLTLFWLLSLPIQWVHWHQARKMPPAAFPEPVAIADHLPGVIRPYGQWYDGLQAWLIHRNVAIRHHQHKLFWQRQEAIYPPRTEGRLLAAKAYPVIVLEAVGVPGWALPTTNIIDAHGLNDSIVARNPVPPHQERNMAHDRYLPPGYAECFQPNVRIVTSNKLVISPRILTPETIRACETAVWSPGWGDVEEVTLLGIDHQRAPIVDQFLWSGLPPDFTMLFFTPPTEEAKAKNQALLTHFPTYAGQGCLVIPPLQALATSSDFWFAFLDAPGLPTLSEWFPWATVLTEDSTTVNTITHLAVTAVAGPDIVPTPTQKTAVSWANNVSLQGYDLAKTSYQSGETVNLTLYYQVHGPLSNDFSSYTHLLGSTYNPAGGGPLWGQQDGNPCRDFYPLEKWQPGSVIVSKAIITIPPEAPPGEYTLATGFYNWLNGERVRLLDDSDNGFLLATIRVTVP